jgi:hypothetical protein
MTRRWFGPAWDDRDEVRRCCLSCPFDVCAGGDDCPRRADCVRAIIRRELGGITLREAARRAGVPWGTFYTRVVIMAEPVDVAARGGRNPDGDV